jgi:hypothetical protein
MPTARKDVADYLNENALEAAKTVVSIASGEIEDRGNTRLAAAKVVLSKCIPDLKAIDLSGQIKAELGKITVDLGGD